MCERFFVALPLLLSGSVGLIQSLNCEKNYLVLKLESRNLSNTFQIIIFFFN